jgi:hypothetical protein
MDKTVQWLVIGAVMFTAGTAAFRLFIYLALRRMWDFQKMGSVPQACATFLGIIALVVGWGVSNQQSIDRDILAKKRDQASIMAEYAALASSLKEGDDVSTYRRANQLSWQLFLWLPTDVYRQLGRGLKDDPKALVDSLVAIRKTLLESEAGTLDGNDIISHGPGIGKSPTTP